MCGACSEWLISVVVTSAMMRSVNEVEEGEEEDPDDVDEVPVETHDLDGSVVLGTEVAFPGAPDEPDQKAGADDHVQRVKPGQAPVEGHEELDFRSERRDLIPMEGGAGKEPFLPVLRVLVHLHAEQDGAEKKRGDDHVDGAH